MQLFEEEKKMNVALQEYRFITAVSAVLLKLCASLFSTTDSVAAECLQMTGRHLPASSTKFVAQPVAGSYNFGRLSISRARLSPKIA